MAQKLHATAKIVDDEGRPTRVFFVILNDLLDAVEQLQSDLDALEALVESHHP